MRQKTTLILISALLILKISGAGRSEIQFGTYVNNNYNYEIIIPSLWPREELTLPDKHFMYALADTNTVIKVRAFKSSEEDIDKTAHSETWDLRKIDPKLQKIIETEKIQIKKDITGKLLIFEYRSLKNNFLQRTLITKNNEIIYILECKSPQKTFYKYEDIFTIAFASFKYKEEGTTTTEQKSETSQEKEENKEKTNLEDTQNNLNSDLEILEEDEDENP